MLVGFVRLPLLALILNKKTLERIGFLLSFDNTWTA
jgi:hypothetical protein